MKQKKNIKGMVKLRIKKETLKTRRKAKRRLIVKNISDVITNSSSEVFILSTNKSLKEVKEIVSHIATGCCDPEILTKESEIIKELRDYDYFMDPNNIRDTEKYYLDLITAGSRFNGYSYIDNKYKELYSNLWRDYVMKNKKYLANYYEEQNKGWLDNYRNNTSRDPNIFNRKTFEEIGGIDIYDLPEGFVSGFLRENKISLPNIPREKSITYLFGKIGIRSSGDNTVDLNSYDNIVNTFDNTLTYHLG